MKSYWLMIRIFQGIFANFFLEKWLILAKFCYRIFFHFYLVVPHFACNSKLSNYITMNDPALLGKKRLNLESSIVWRPYFPQYLGLGVTKVSKRGENRAKIVPKHHIRTFYSGTSGMRHCNLHTILYNLDI